MLKAQEFPRRIQVTADAIDTPVGTARSAARTIVVKVTTIGLERGIRAVESGAHFCRYGPTQVVALELNGGHLDQLRNFFWDLPGQ